MQLRHSCTQQALQNDYEHILAAKYKRTSACALIKKRVHAHQVVWCKLSWGKLAQTWSRTHICITCECSAWGTLFLYLMLPKKRWAQIYTRLQEPTTLEHVLIRIIHTLLMSFFIHGSANDALKHIKLSNCKRQQVRAHQRCGGEFPRGQFAVFAVRLLANVRCVW